MSHVAIYEPEKEELQIRCLPALQKACQRLGLELVKQSHYRTWKDDHGSFVGDYPVPEGFNAEELGENAEYVARIAGLSDHERTQRNAPYEVGMVQSKKNPGSFVPAFDFYAGGNGLVEKCGDGAGKLLMHYRMECDRITAQEQGDEITFKEQPDGTWIGISDVDEDRVQEGA